MRRFTILLWGLLSAAGVSADADGLTGYWQGTAERNGETTTIAIRLNDAGAAPAGAFDTPDFGTLGRPLTTLDTKRRRVTLHFGEGDGACVVEAQLREEQLSGTWLIPSMDFSAAIALRRIPDPRPYSTEEVSFVNKNDATKIAGTVFMPTGPGPHPGIVLIHGSGDNERWWREYNADLFARAGFAALFFDKRGNGNSSGDWNTVGFEALARDGIAGIEYLESRSDTDSERLGFWGISQAGWIMPLAATLSDDVSFVVVTSGATVSVEEEGYYDYIVRLRDAGYSEADQAEARRVLELDYRVTMTGEGYDELRAAVKESVKKPWWKLMSFYVAPAKSPLRNFSRLIGGFDPVPVLERVDIPIVWMYGEADKSVEPRISIDILERLISGHDKPWTIQTFGEADHGIRVRPAPDAAFPFRRHARGYNEAMTTWLKSRVAGNGPQ